MCQGFFILAASFVLALDVLPPQTRHLLLAYGARDSSPRPRQHGKDGGGWLDKTVAQLTSRSQIPHSWFASFYAAYLACAAFWALQCFTGGRVLGYFVACQAATQAPSMALSQVWTASILMALQAVRRLYEQFVVMRPSKSTMWLVHWLLGLVFYLTLSVSIWVEGSRKLHFHRRTVSAAS